MVVLIGRFLTIQNEFSLPESRKPLHILMYSWVSFLLLSLLPRDSNCGERHEEVLLLSLDVRVTPMIVVHPRVFFFVGVVVRSWPSSDWSKVVCTICSQLDGYKFKDNIQLLLNVRLRWCRFDSNFCRLGRLLNATWAATRLRSAKLQSLISHGNFLASTIQRWVCVSSKKGAVRIDLSPNLSTPQKDLFLKPSTRLVRTEASTDENATVLTCNLKLRLFRFAVRLNIFLARSTDFRFKILRWGLLSLHLVAPIDYRLKVVWCRFWIEIFAVVPIRFDFSDSPLQFETFLALLLRRETWVPKTSQYFPRFGLVHKDLQLFSSYTKETCEVLVHPSPVRSQALPDWVIDSKIGLSSAWSWTFLFLLVIESSLPIVSFAQPCCFILLSWWRGGSNISSG